MNTVMVMHWADVSREQYDQLREKLAMESNPPRGAKFHVAWFEGDGLHVLDVWQSREEFERFQRDKLGPLVQEIGISGRPDVRFAEAHSIFAPDI